MMVSGWQRRAVQARVWANVWRVAHARYTSPVRAAQAVRALARLRSSVRDGRPTPRIARVGERYFMHMYTPGWPSLAFDRFVENEFMRLDAAESPGAAALRLQCVIMGITRQCPLRCEHCCEWDVLNQPDVLSVESRLEIVKRFQSLGATQIQFSGGEPLTRADDIIHIMTNAQPGTDFWLLTSGVGLTGARARELRRAKLAGVSVSLDHWDADVHNRFRGSDHAFAWAQRAALSAREAGLVVAFSICPTRQTATRDNLIRYTRNAARLGASFIQIVEPRAVGHFAGQDVELQPAQQQMLEQFFNEFNFSRRHRRMPVIVYQEMANRRLGCAGAGMRYAYVDTAGELHPCPFCRRESGSALDDNLEQHLTAMAQAGCPSCATPSHEHAPGVVSAR